MNNPPAVTVLTGDCLDILPTLPTSSVDAIVTDPPAGIAFMGKAWDTNKGGRSQWISWLTSVMEEADRVLKPGGHALVWALPRTSHWTATALEDAGFEIRDCVVHLFGSGFPKSHDVGKALNKATGDAKHWAGWGTALKPGQEHWWLVRKTLEGTVAANVLEHGTGALNIGDCRVSPTGESRPRVGESSQDRRYTERGGTNFAPLPGMRGGAPEGRWPTNLALTHSAACPEAGLCEPDCPVGELDRQSGTTKSGSRKAGTYGLMGYMGADAAPMPAVVGDSGGASRFYPTFRYQAKAPSKERPKVNGISHPTAKPLGLVRWLVRMITPPGGTVLDPFAGSGTTLEAAALEGFSVIGIEAEADYLPLIQARLDRVPVEGVA